MVRDIPYRVVELVREEGLSGLFSGVKRFLWWECGGKRLEYLWYRTTGRPVPRLVGGTRAKFDVGSLDEFKRVKSLSGEEKVLEWFLEVLRPEDVVWDVEANVGVYSMFAKQVGDTVVAFEPHPANLRRLRENASLNGVQLDVRPVALSNRSGVAELAVEDHGPGAGGGEVADAGSYEIELVRGADVEPTPDVVKIDVEGHELDVLAGLGDAVSSVRIALVEVHGREDSTPIREFFEENGFEVNQRWNIGTRTFLVATR